MKCNVCDKPFKNYRALNGHKSTHARTEQYSQSRRSIPATFDCIECGAVSPHGWSKRNKFCSLKCKNDWKWKHITVPAIEAGDKTHNSTSTLKKYLRDKFGDVCSCCGQLPVWNGKPLQLQLDHIDGNSDNNLPTNLRLLCPNCHTQTNNFGSRGKGKRYHKVAARNKYIRQYRGNARLV